MRSPRPLWTPFLTTSGLMAIRTPTGVVPYLPTVHGEQVAEYQARQATRQRGEPVHLWEEAEHARTLAEALGLAA